MAGAVGPAFAGTRGRGFNRFSAKRRWQQRGWVSDRGPLSARVLVPYGAVVREKGDKGGQGELREVYYE